MTQLTCKTCGVLQPADNFYRHPSTASGRVGTCKACRSQYEKTRSSDTWRRRYGTPEARVNHLYNAARSRRPDGFTLTKEHIRQQIEAGICTVTGVPFVLDQGEAKGDRRPAHPFAPSIDRRDNTLPYTDENTRVVVWVYNRAKHTDSDAEVLMMARALVAVHG